MTTQYVARYIAEIEDILEHLGVAPKPRGKRKFAGLLRNQVVFAGVAAGLIPVAVLLGAGIALSLLAGLFM